jgi:hypothetical protein
MDTVARCLIEGDTSGGWQALQTVYAELPPDCQKECSADLREIRNQLELINAPKGVTLAENVWSKASAKQNYLAQTNLLLFDKFKNVLFAKGYLENSPAKPRNLQPTTLGEQE